MSSLNFSNGSGGESAMSDPADRTDDDRPRIGIGALSRATDIPPETLRTWERRYGFPSPDRSKGGHRLYEPALIEHLRQLKRALDAGHRPKQVMELEMEELLSLMEETGIEPVPRPRHALPGSSRGSDSPAPSEGSGEGAMSAQTSVAVDAPPATVIGEWVQATEHLEMPVIEHGFRTQWLRVGMIRFLEEYVGPFLHAVGEEWAAGRLTVAHEHFASERVRDFLAGSWRSLAEANSGPTVVCATLPDEQHHLGLHMAACVLALGGCRVLFLGMDSPLADVAAAVHQRGAAAVVVSVSEAMHATTAKNRLLRLRGELDDDVELVVGGGGLRDDIEGIRRPRSFADLLVWASELS